jgi:hypothetical protein
LLIGNAAYPDADALLKEPVTDAREQAGSTVWALPAPATDLPRCGRNLLTSSRCRPSMRRREPGLCSAQPPIKIATIEQPSSIRTVIFSSGRLGATAENFTLPIKNPGPTPRVLLTAVFSSLST